MTETARASQLPLATHPPRNWPVRVSLSILGAIALLCLIGPLVSGHPYDQVYRDYVLVGPSLYAHPDAREIEDAVAAIARRMHVTIKAAHWRRDPSFDTRCRKAHRSARFT